MKEDILRQVEEIETNLVNSGKKETIDLEYIRELSDRIIYFIEILNSSNDINFIVDNMPEELFEEEYEVIWTDDMKEKYKGLVKRAIQEFNIGDIFK